MGLQFIQYKKFTQDKTNIKAKLFEIGYQRELNRITHKKTKS